MLEKQTNTNDSLLSEHFALEPKVSTEEEKDLLGIPYTVSTIKTEAENSVESPAGASIAESTKKKEVEDAPGSDEVKLELFECSEVKVEGYFSNDASPERVDCDGDNCFTPDLVEKINQEARNTIRKQWSSLLNKDSNYSSDPSNPESLICQKCHLNFKSKSDLLQHEENHGDTVFRCSQCPMVFDREFSLKVHQAFHGTPRPHTCEICGKTFTRRTSLNDHALSHSGKKPYQCDVCKKYYRSKVSLISHLRCHYQSKKYECPVCKKLFFLSWHLKEHLRMHKNAKDFKCDICSKHFSYRSTLKRHVKAHVGAMRHACDMCDKVYRQNASLMQHKRTFHLGLKPFKCEDCDKTFTKSWSLKLHMNTHRVLQVPNTIQIVTREKDG